MVNGSEIAQRGSIHCRCARFSFFLYFIDRPYDLFGPFRRSGWIKIGSDCYLGVVGSVGHGVLVGKKCLGFRFRQNRGALGSLLSR